MRADKARNLRVCFRADRATYWLLRSDAQELGFTLSTWVFWLVMAALSETGECDLLGKVQWVRDALGTEAAKEFTTTVHKSSDILYAEE